MTAAWLPKISIALSPDLEVLSKVGETILTLGWRWACEGSHLDWDGVGTEHRRILPCVDAGSYLLFDYRLRHRLPWTLPWPPLPPPHRTRPPPSLGGCVPRGGH